MRMHTRENAKLWRPERRTTEHEHARVHKKMTAASRKRRDATIPGREQANIGSSRVRYNNWRQLNVPTLDAFAPTLPVSVVISYFEMPNELAKTLAALERQTYPRHLFEVVIVDDCSEPPLALPPSTLDIRVVRRAGTGCRPAAGNFGAAAATHPILVFLDADVLPEAEHLAAHARWHHAVSDALTVVWCNYVDVSGVAPDAIRDHTGSLKELFSGREFDRSWIEAFVRNTDGQTKIDIEQFDTVTGNFGITKAFFESVGGFNESFVRYGFHDTEFGYRAYSYGALIIPDEKYVAWHQGRLQGNRGSTKHRDLDLTREKLAHLVPVSRFRGPPSGRQFIIPHYAVTVRVGDQPRAVIAESVETFLADPNGDLVVRVELAVESCPLRTDWLRERYGPDARVSIAVGTTALEDFPSAALHVSVPAVPAKRGLLKRLRDALGDGVAARIALPDGAGDARIVRTWALHRARRTGLPIEHFGDVITFFPGGGAAPVSRNVGKMAPASAVSRDVGKWRRALRRMLGEMRSVRDVRGAAWFLMSLTSRVLNWLMRKLGLPAPRRGSNAGPVAGASSSEESSAPPAEPEEPELSFDLAVHNPVDWRHQAGDHVGALGLIELLPVGSRIPRTVKEADRPAIQICHHLVDIAAFHPDPQHRARTLVRLLAAGAPIHVLDPEPELRRLLGPELFDLIASGDVRTADTAGREQISVEMRRIALRDHSTYGRHRAGLPTVSVLLATRRPRFLQWAIANVARQNYPRLELVLALHGAGFEQAAVDRAMASLRISATVVRVAEPELSCASVLNAATEAASGTLVAKMDDDDLYDEHHIWDLVLGYAYSKADVVGKTSQFVYLARPDKTLRRDMGPRERFNSTIVGSSILVAKQTVDEVEGWPRVWLQDYALLDAILGIGGSVYRIHGSGLIVMRHGDHIWHKADDQFLSAAEEVRDGWQPSIAGFADPLPPLPHRGDIADGSMIH